MVRLNTPRSSSHACLVKSSFSVRRGRNIYLYMTATSPHDGCSQGTVNRAESCAASEEAREHSRSHEVFRISNAFDEAARAQTLLELCALFVPSSCLLNMVLSTHQPAGIIASPARLAPLCNEFFSLSRYRTSMKVFTIVSWQCFDYIHEYRRWSERNALKKRKQREGQTRD